MKKIQRKTKREEISKHFFFCFNESADLNRWFHFSRLNRLAVKGIISSIFDLSNDYFPSAVLPTLFLLRIIQPKRKIIDIISLN